MICAHCRLEDYGGFHSKGWCFDWLGPEQPAAVPVDIRPMLNPVPEDRSGRNAAYRSGLCVDCRTARHSPGRPRCNACHAEWVGQPHPPGLVRGQLGSCAAKDCRNPTMPGKVLCSPCTRARVEAAP
jgi:hypothetical protein